YTNKQIDNVIKMNRIFFALISFAVVSTACNNPQAVDNTESSIADTVKIVSLNGTLSEIVVGLGMEGNIVGVDVTSTYPESLKSKPTLGHNRGISAEGVLSLAPDVVLALRKDVSQELA